MSTKYSMEVRDAETGEYVPVSLWADFIPVNVLQEMCETLSNLIDGADAIIVVDVDTGEIVAEAIDDNSTDNWGYNEDMGFDPYLGCYTDDC